MWKVIGKVVGAFLRSSWMLPTVAAVGVLLFLGLAWGMSYVEMNADVDVPTWLSYMVVAEFLVSVLLGLMVPVWLIVMTVKWIRSKKWGRLALGWGSSACAAIVAWLVAMGLLMLALAGPGDSFAKGLDIPEDVDFVVPRNMTFFADEEFSERVQQLRNLRPELPPLPESEPLLTEERMSEELKQLQQKLDEPVGGQNEAEELQRHDLFVRYCELKWKEEDKLEQEKRREMMERGMDAGVDVPHLRKLAQVAPELLQEYILRALYAEATNPRFQSAVLAYDDSVYLIHENDPQSCVYGRERQVEVVSEHGTYTYADTPEGKYSVKLENGWSVGYHARFTTSPYEDKLPSFLLELEGQLHRLDAELSPLAQTPTRTKLDSLLPPLPDKPFVCLWGDGAGTYRMLMVIPPDYPEGTFELRAEEYTTGKRIRFKNRFLPEKRLGNVCRIICSDRWNTVYSGDWNEYYGSRWQIWFTPKDGGEPQCVNSQNFLMMGWMH